MLSLTGRFDWSISMRTIQASEAKTQLLRLLDEVERGEHVVITRHGKPVAEIVPHAEADRVRIERAVANIQEIRKRTQPVSVDEILAWRDEGRR